MILSVLFAFLSSAFDSLNQIIILEREYRTWLENYFPNFFRWNTGIFHLDAWHTYQAFGIGFVFLSGYFAILSNSWWLVLYWIAYYQVRNLFMHVIWMKPGYRDWRPVRVGR